MTLLLFHVATICSHDMNGEGIIDSTRCLAFGPKWFDSLNGHIMEFLMDMERPRGVRKWVCDRVNIFLQFCSGYR